MMMFALLVFGAIGFKTLPPDWLIYMAVSALIFVLAYRDVKLSTRFGLTLEALSVAAIIVISVHARLRGDATSRFWDRGACSIIAVLRRRSDQKKS